MEVHHNFRYRKLTTFHIRIFRLTYDFFLHFFLYPTHLVYFTSYQRKFSFLLLRVKFNKMERHLTKGFVLVL